MSETKNVLNEKKNYMTQNSNTKTFLYTRQISFQERRVWIPLTGLTPPHFGACPEPGLRFPTSYVMVFLYPRNEVVEGYSGFTMSVCRQILCHTIT